MMPKINGIAHQAMGVRDIEKSIAWYTDVLGMECMNFINDGVAFMSFGMRDHDIALVKIPEDQPVGSSGAAHTAFEIEGGPAELREIYDRLREQGIKVYLTIDHQVSYSLYLMDPDNNRLEIFTHMMAFDEASRFRRENSAIKDVMRPLDMSKVGAQALIS